MSLAANHHAAAPPEAASPCDERAVRDALAHLDDPAYLQTHPPCPLARSGTRPTAGQRLRQALLDAIAALRPAIAADSHAGRSYHLLHLRHVEGKPIPAVLDALAISRSEC